jgi:hypothetical protein
MASRRRTASARLCEPLERRTLLCIDHLLPKGEIVELAPETIDPDTGISPTRPGDAADPADIVWTNRGQASDNFNARFGTMANQARAVVDAVIDYFEVMIGSFNYPSAGQVYNLTLSMGASGSGFGASAGLNSSLGGKPKSGSVTMGAGNGSADPNDDNGWFLDPTPYDNNEFQGNIVNAFAGDAHAGSPAQGRSDFFTVVAAELTHCVGLFGNALPGWHNLTTNTGIPDNASPPGFFWTFDGPSIKHLLTSDNGGFQDWGSAVHSSEGPGANINFNGMNWIGAHDIGNPFYEGSRRYMVNKTFQLMLKDAYAYSTTEIGNWGTFYSSPFETGTGIVRVRGGTGSSADNVEIFRSAGNTLTVAVNVGNDVAGTGALPGAGDLPAWVHVYDISSVSQIIVDTGAGDDNIFIDTTNFSAALAESISITAGTGNDDLTVGFFGQNLDFFTSPISFDGGSGTDTIVLYDHAGAFNDSYSTTYTTLDRVVFGGLTHTNHESVYLTSQSGNNTFNLEGVAPGVTLTIEGRNGNDTFNFGLPGGSAEGIDGAVVVHGQNGQDTVNYNDITAANADFTLSSNTIARSFNVTATYNTVEALNLHATNTNNIITFGTPPALVNPLTVHGNNGNDTFQYNLTDNAGTASFLHGGAGTDAIVINDSRTSPVFANAVHGDSFFFAALQHSYATMESLTWNRTGAAVNDTFYVYSTNPATPVTINAGAGNDTFDLGGIFQNIDPIDGALTLNGEAGSDTILVNDQGAAAGTTHTLNATTYTRNAVAPVSYPGCEAMSINAGSADDTINVIAHPAGFALTVDGRSGLDAVLVNSDGAGTAAVRFAVTQDLSNLQISNGGTATLLAGGNKLIETDGLTVGATGKLDLNDNDLMFDYPGASQLTVIAALIASARNGGAWDGNGITSSSADAAAAGNTTLGAIEGSTWRDLYGTGTPFNGKPVDATSVLVKYTYYGDTDFNGTLDGDDYARADNGFNTGAGGWFNGDADLNNVVDGDDYALIDNAFNTQSATL